MTVVLFGSASLLLTAHFYAGSTGADVGIPHLSAVPTSVSTDRPRSGVSPFGRDQLGVAPPDPLVALHETTREVYGRSGRAFKLDGKTIGQYIAKRLGAARSGDMKAAYEVYKAESVCANRDEPVEDYNSAAEREHFLKARDGINQLCKDISLAQIQERLGFLAAAARAGNVEAQVDFYMEGLSKNSIDLLESSADPAAQQWREDALGFLKQAASKCDQFALALLATEFEAGNIVARDKLMAMAYGVAEAISRKIPITQAKLRGRFGDEVPEAELEHALQLGRELTMGSCKPNQSVG